MEKTIFVQMGGTYQQQGDYLIPGHTLLAEEEKSIDVFGQRHLRYLKTHRKTTYTNLLTIGKLNAYLANINEQTDDMFFARKTDGTTQSGKSNEVDRSDE